MQRFFRTCASAGLAAEPASDELESPAWFLHSASNHRATEDWERLRDGRGAAGTACKAAWSIRRLVTGAGAHSSGRQLAIE